VDCCGNCIFGRLRGPVKPLVETDGESDCRRFPPVLSKNSIVTSPAGHYQFPIVGNGEWCGEYQAKPAPTPPAQTTQRKGTK
jgi:hypothetical protein